MSRITTHVLDVSAGRPAAGVPVIVEALAVDGTWAEKGSGLTDGDGRLKDLAAGNQSLPGTYRVTFNTSAYFAAQNITGLYPQVTIVFEITNATEDYHIPLLLSPYGYSTYRGS
jgi:5-hydroxyisourate hydrolase